MISWAMLTIGYLLVGGGLVYLHDKKTPFPRESATPGIVVSNCLRATAWPLLVVILISDLPAALRSRNDNLKFAVRRKDLRENFTVSEVEAREIVRDPLGAAPEVAFGHLNSSWRKFRAQLPEDANLTRFEAIWRGSRGSRIVEGYSCPQVLAVTA
jgi:hypothetical protein